MTLQVLLPQHQGNALLNALHAPIPAETFHKTGGWPLLHEGLTGLPIT
jgi:hypothetical protein